MRAGSDGRLPDRVEPNPFATRFTRAGALPPLNEDGSSFDAAAVLAALEKGGGCGAFVGPHGSGKSTRLEASATAAGKRGLVVKKMRLRRVLDLLAALRQLLTLPSGSLLCIDSLELAGRLGASWLVRLARLRGILLLATCHEPLGLPVLVDCRTSLELLERILDHLPPHDDCLNQHDLADAFAASDGNLREALFALYDRVEAARRRQRS